MQGINLQTRVLIDDGVRLQIPYTVNSKTYTLYEGTSEEFP